MDEETPLVSSLIGFESSGEVSESSCKVQIPNYGTRGVDRALALEKRVVYSWNGINVFAEGNVSSKRWFGNAKKIEATKHILKNVSGVAHPGELLAILGSSGSGKTTLLNALTFRSSRTLTVSGVRSLNGSPASAKALAAHAAYVQQEDLFIGTLTVQEHLTFQALVRMDRNVSKKERMARVQEVIKELALSKCKDTLIGITGRMKGISGGEKKRLAFAAEVLTNPAVMFCDEPTSGLDSFMALNVVQVLKAMASSGKTIVCTIHQPSSEIYAMFDKVLLMAEGRVAFLGTPLEADEFFALLEAPCPKNYNPADYFIQLLAVVPEREESCRQAINMICDSYHKSDLGVRIAIESANTTNDYQDIYSEDETFKSPYKASWINQFQAVLWRSWLSVIKEPLLMKVRILQTIMIALIIGAIYYGQELNQDGIMNINGALFIFLTNMTFQNVFAVINVFCSELPVFLREHRNGMYRTDVYFLSKTVSELPIFILMPLLFTSTSYYMIGLNPSFSHFAAASGIMILVGNVSTSFGYLISCLASGVSMALSIGPPLIIPFLLFGGFFLNVNSVPVYIDWLSYLSWFKYGNEALLINQWQDVSNISCPILNSTCPRNGHVVLEMYNFHEENFLMDVWSLCGLIVGFRVMAYLALLWKACNNEQ